MGRVSSHRLGSDPAECEPVSNADIPCQYIRPFDICCIYEGALRNSYRLSTCLNPTSLFPIPTFQGLTPLAARGGEIQVQGSVTATLGAAQNHQGPTASATSNRSLSECSQPPLAFRLEGGPPARPRSEEQRERKE